MFFVPLCFLCAFKPNQLRRPPQIIQNKVCRTKDSICALAMLMVVVMVVVVMDQHWSCGLSSMAPHKMKTSSKQQAEQKATRYAPSSHHIFFLARFFLCFYLHSTVYFLHTHTHIFMFQTFSANCRRHHRRIPFCDRIFMVSSFEPFSGIFQATLECVSSKRNWHFKIFERTSFFRRNEI